MLLVTITVPACHIFYFLLNWISDIPRACDERSYVICISWCGAFLSLPVHILIAQQNPFGRDHPFLFLPCYTITLTLIIGLECESRSVVSDTLRSHGPYSPWNSPGQNTGVEPFPSPADLPKPEIKCRSPALQVDSLPAEPQGKPQVGLRWHECIKHVTEEYMI